MIVPSGLFGHMAGIWKEDLSNGLVLEVQAAQQVSAEGLQFSELSLDYAVCVLGIEVELHITVAFMQVPQEGFASRKLAIVNYHASTYEDLQVDSKGVKKQGPKINPLPRHRGGKCT